MWKTPGKKYVLNAHMCTIIFYWNSEASVVSVYVWYVRMWERFVIDAYRRTAVQRIEAQESNSVFVRKCLAHAQEKHMSSRE